MNIVEAYLVVSTMGEDRLFLIEEEAASDAEYDGMYDEGYTIVDEYGGTYGFYPSYYDAELELCKRRGGVSIGPDYIAIYDMGEEICFWHEDEWKENPELAINLANAIRTYYVKGPAFMRQLLKK